MVGCVVPGCTNRTIRWTARVPEDDQLRASWRAAILGGTGRLLSEAQLDGKHVCQLHFPVHQQPERGQMYREPTLFLVNRTWREVSCCQLCLQYKPVLRMFNRKYCLEQSYSLQSLAYKYFRVRQFIKSTTQESYFCEACVVQLDITHRFCEQINDNSRAYERILRKMSKTIVMFDRNELESLNGGVGLALEEMGSADDRVIQEEPQVEREMRILNANFGQTKAESLVETGQSDCEVEENECETIEVDDEDYEPAVKIKKESDLDEETVKIKQEVPDEEPPPPELAHPIQVKQEALEQVESPSPDKKQRLEFKYGCVMCKSLFKSQAALTQHLNEVVHDKTLESKCVSCRVSILPSQTQDAKCGNCDTGSTKTPKILNKQFTSEKSVPTSHQCGTCNRKFSTEIALKHHQKHLTCKSPNNVCAQCNETFLIEEDLIAHLELAHVASRRGKKCESCGEVISAIFFDLHQLLLCGENLPEPDEAHLKRCVLLFFRQMHHPTKAYEMLRSKFGGQTGVTQDMVDTWYAQFVQGGCLLSDVVQANIKKLIDENDTIGFNELSEQLGVDFDTVRVRTGLMGLMPKYGRWVPQELPPSLLKNRFNFCRALLARYKHNTSLNDMILCSERWVYYGNASHQLIKNTKEPPKKVLLCVWWDHRGLIFHELLEPQQAAAPDRYQAQFSRFTKAMQTARQKVPRHVSFQYGITEPAARQELKTIITGIGWELLRHPDHSPDIDPTDYHLFQSMQYGLQNLYFANPGQVYEWVAKSCKEQLQMFFLRGIRMLLKRWEKVVENKGDYCGQ